MEIKPECELWNLFSPQSIDRIFHFSCHIHKAALFVSAQNQHHQMMLAYQRERTFFSSWWCWLPFISKFYPPESIYMEENYTVYRHINTFNSTLVVVVDDTMHTKIQLTIIWLDVSSFQIQIKLLHREIYPHFTWEFSAVANFSHRARFIPFLLAHLTLAAVNSAVQSFFVLPLGMQRIKNF